MSGRKGPATVPYDSEGNLVGYARREGDPLTRYGYDDEGKWGPQPDGEWRPNDPFRKTLYYVDWEPTSSSSVLLWEDADGHRFRMFMSDAHAILLEGRVGQAFGPGIATSRGCVAGTWRVVKRGSAYGVQRVGA